MKIANPVFLVTGGASGLSAATARMVVEGGGRRCSPTSTKRPARRWRSNSARRPVSCAPTVTDDDIDAGGGRAAASAGPASAWCAARAWRRARSDGPHGLEPLCSRRDDQPVGTFNLIRPRRRRDEQGHAQRGVGERGVIVTTRLGRRLRRPDRPGDVCGVQGRRGRHDAADRARAGTLRHPRDEHRPRHLRDADAARAAAGGAGFARARWCLSPRASQRICVQVPICENPMLNGEVIRPMARSAWQPSEEPCMNPVHDHDSRRSVVLA